MVECEARFYDLARYATIPLLTEYEGIRYFIRGLKHILYMDAQSLVAVSRLFIDIADYAYTIEDLYFKVSWGAIRDLVNRVVKERDITTNSLRAKVVSTNINTNNHTSIRVRIVGPLM